MSIDTPDSISFLTQAYMDLFPKEAAHVLESVDTQDIVAALEHDDGVRAARMLSLFSPSVASACIEEFQPEALQRILPQMEPGWLASLFLRLQPHVQEQRLGSVDPQLASELRELMSYPPGTAGHLMDARVLSFRAALTAEEVIAQLQTLRERRIRDLFVVNDDGQLIGAIPIHMVILSEPQQCLEELIAGPSPNVQPTATSEAVVETLSQSRLSSMPVVDYEGRLIGAIRQDALVQAVQEQATIGMQTMVGVSKSERALSKPMFAVRKRLPWLNINLLTAFLAAAVVGVFESTIAKFTALAVLLPVVAGQSGNTGAQALAVTMRGLALREIGIRHWPRVMGKEALVGAINGFAIAAVTMLGVYVWSGSPGLCGVIGVAMVLSMAMASVAGTAIPVVLTSLGQDPAQSSSIILTTVTDVVGFLSFLGLATLFSQLL